MIADDIGRIMIAETIISIANTTAGMANTDAGMADGALTDIGARAQDSRTCIVTITTKKQMPPAQTGGAPFCATEEALTVHHPVQQGSLEWYNLKKGMPTASQFHRIVTPAKWQLSSQARRYAFQLATEILLDELSHESLDGIEAVRRGRILEPEAVSKYEQESKSETALVGLLTTDDGRIGASPDRLIIGVCPAGLEVKCPAPWTHLEYMIDGFGADYLPQAQGQILVGEFDFVDRYSYHPQAPSVLVRTWRDDEKQQILQQVLLDFLDIRDEIIDRARRMGVFTPEIYVGRNDE